MKRILIANRGEIACRIIRSCKKLGLQSIAVYSDIDKNSKHVREADESIHIGGSKAQESYLLAEKIIEVAIKLNADAIHPGYGFMAENAEFAQNVIDSGIIWIGPKPSTIISMGNKDVARDLAIKNNLPICPGLKDEDLKKDDLEKKCNEIGYPILIKASAGGGGIGMQIANNYENLVQSIEKTKNLAKKAFGNSDIFLEKFISNARHIEIQVFGLGERKALHFYERDCSIQRRFQKIIEESPAPEIKDSIINEMAESAVNFVTNQKYEGAGTIEFIYHIDNKKFYFLLIFLMFFSCMEPNNEGLWSVDQISVFNTKGFCRSVSVEENIAYVASGQAGVQIWNLETGQVLHEYLGYSQDGSYIEFDDISIVKRDGDNNLIFVTESNKKVKVFFLSNIEKLISPLMQLEFTVTLHQNRYIRPHVNHK